MHLSRRCLQARDPIPQLKKVILEGNLLTQDELKQIEQEVVAEVEAAVQFADESPKPVHTQPHRLSSNLTMLFVSTCPAITLVAQLQMGICACTAA